jgi:hypothetical protein
MLTRRVGKRTHRPRRLGRLHIGVKAHPAKIVPKARLHGSTDILIQRLPRRAQDVVDDGRHIGDRGRADRGPLQNERAASRSRALRHGELAHDSPILTHSSSLTDSRIFCLLSRIWSHHAVSTKN